MNGKPKLLEKKSMSKVSSPNYKLKMYNIFYTSAFTSYLQVIYKFTVVASTPIHFLKF